MSETPESGRPWTPTVGAAVSVLVVFVAVLPVPLAAAATLGLTRGETTSWIMTLYGVAAVLSLVLVARTRQPLLLTGNVFLLVFIASLGARLSWSELVGATMLAGAAILVLGPLGLSTRLVTWLPAPIVFGLLAGAVTPFVLDVFITIGGGNVSGLTVAPEEQWAAAGALVAYLAGRRWLEPQLPAILPAAVVGLAIAAVTGVLGSAPGALGWPRPVVTAPELSLTAVLTATPVMIVVIMLQANVPSIVYLRTQDYMPPERLVTVTSGAGTLLGSLLGPIGVSLSLPGTALSAGPTAGPHDRRHVTVVTVCIGALVIALFAGVAAELTTIVPRSLLLTFAGLALFNVLVTSLQRIVAGPLMLGPIFTFAIALVPSDVTLFGLGPFFWALAVGLGVSRLLEREGWHGG